MLCCATVQLRLCCHAAVPMPPLVLLALAAAAVALPQVEELTKHVESLKQQTDFKSVEMHMDRKAAELSLQAVSSSSSSNSNSTDS